MVVTASYNDGSTKEVTNYTISPSGSLTTSNNQITISYTEGGVTRTAVQNITVTERIELEIELKNGYTAEKEGDISYINNLTPGLKVEDIIETNGETKLYKGETQITDTSKKLGTGMRIEIEKEGNQKQEYIIIVTGDCNGDGEADIKDMVKINNYRLYGTTTNFGATYQKAADINKDGSIDIKDMVRINNYRLYGIKL